jgi:hypothetical protein
MFEEQLTAVCFLTMGVLGIAQYLFFQRASLNRKREWYPWIILGNAVVFSLVAVSLIPGAFWMILVSVPIISWLQYRTTRFCSCGAMLFPTNGFSPPTFCQKCGAKVLS